MAALQGRRPLDAHQRHPHQPHGSGAADAPGAITAGPPFPYFFAPPRPAAGTAGPFTFAFSAAHLAIRLVYAVSCSLQACSCAAVGGISDPCMACTAATI